MAQAYLVLVTSLLFIGQFNSYVAVTFIGVELARILFGAKASYSREVVILTSVLIYGTCVSFIVNPELFSDLAAFFSVSSDGARGITRLALLNRENLILALSLPFLEGYLRRIRTSDLRRIFWWGLAGNMCFGIGELLTEDLANYRMSLSFSEPSAAGYYLSIVLIVLLMLERKRIPGIALGVASIIFIRSKAFMLTFAFLATYIAKSKILRYSIGICTAALLLYVIGNVSAFNVLGDFYHLALEQGLKLDTSLGVEDTFVTRLSGMVLGVVCLVENCFGVGIGSFHDFFLANYERFGVYGNEVLGVNTGKYYATPNSNLLELFVVCGLMALPPMFLYLKRLERVGQSRIFWMLILLSFLLELNPWLFYLIFLCEFSERQYGSSDFGIQ